MKRKQVLGAVFFLAVLAYAGTYAYLYSIKEQQGNRFKGEALPADYQYAFEEPFEELNFTATDGGKLNSVLFKADSSKGVVCFWKGNGGTVKDWAQLAPQFLHLHYDILITDYRQHGKSRGNISLENFYTDAQLVYNYLKKRYGEKRIIVAGFSLGGRIAAHLAADNQPRLTLLIDPASATGDFSDRFAEALFAPLPSVNEFIFETEKDVQLATSPVVVIGTSENRNSVSRQLQPLLKKKDRYYEWVKISRAASR